MIEFSKLVLNDTQALNHLSFIKTELKFESDEENRPLIDRLLDFFESFLRMVIPHYWNRTAILFCKTVIAATAVKFVRWTKNLLMDYSLK